jgi:hypothetical protein
MAYKTKITSSSVVVTSQRSCEVTTIQSIFKMSSFFANKLDKSIIFAVQ